MRQGVCHLVPHDGRKLVIAADEAEQPAEDNDLSRGEAECIDAIRIDDAEFPLEPIAFFAQIDFLHERSNLRGLDEPVANLVNTASGGVVTRDDLGLRQDLPVSFPPQLELFVGGESKYLRPMARAFASGITTARRTANGSHEEPTAQGQGQSDEWQPSSRCAMVLRHVKFVSPRPRMATIGTARSGGAFHMPSLLGSFSGPTSRRRNPWSAGV